MTSIQQAQEIVTEFQARVRNPKAQVDSKKSPHHDALCQAVHELTSVAKTLELVMDQCPIALRLQLETEELAEKFQAILDGDEVAALDGAADQLYVQLGTAAVFDWPLQAAFEEVHRSNMTKERLPGRGNRIKEKGPNYKPPDIAGVLRDHRAVCYCGMLMRDHHQGSSCATPREMEGRDDA